MQRCYLVCYDIRDPRRLHRVHRAMKGYGEPWQYSVFFCKLRSVDRVMMERDLMEEMNTKEDQVLIIDMGPSEKAVRDYTKVLGQSLPGENRNFIIV